MNYLNDKEFLTALDKTRVKIQYAKIVLLDYDENPIKEIQGTIQSGSLSVNGSAAIRRTINLTMLAGPHNSNLENIENDISLNKKVKIYIGYENYLSEYKHYGKIVWFPCGVFLIATANLSRSTNSWSISITGKDKMVLLDGTVGGVLPASTTFHERYIYHEDEKKNKTIIIENPTIFQIIYEAVHQFGKENPANIFINDIDEYAKILIKYIGSNPIWFDENYNSFAWENPTDVYTIKKVFGDDVGYRLTPFTYPGELILNAGDTVVTLLDKIKNVLGNFEYFYDVEGRFIFQQQKNYLNTASPLDELIPEDYFQSYSNTKYEYSLTDLTDVISITVNPKYDNIKNDFIVWGRRTTPAGSEQDIRYHLAIDVKPQIYYADRYFYYLEEKDDNNNVTIITYLDFKTIFNFEEEGKKEELALILGRSIAENSELILIGIPVEDDEAAWREEIYRIALLAQNENNLTETNERINSYDYSYYYPEMLAEWRNLYDNMNEKWSESNGWNPNVKNDPRLLDFWIDFIDNSNVINKYSVNMIGRRTKVINDTNIKLLMNKEIPDIYFVDANVELSEKEKDEIPKWFQLNSTTQHLFVTSSTGMSTFDKIRELVYLHLCYNTQITFQCSPKYYMEPNHIIYIEDKETGIIGNYSITQFTLPLSHNGTMSITATEVLTRV